MCSKCFGKELPPCQILYKPKNFCRARKGLGTSLALQGYAGSVSSGFPSKMIFLTSELANKAEIAILSARDTTRVWVPGRGIMGRNVGVYKKGYNTWLSSRPQNQPRSFRRSFCLIFPLLCA